MTDFRDMLSRNTGEVERPKPIPVGTYLMTVLRHETGESSLKKTPFVRFFFRLQSPGEDVDQELLPENWQTRELRTEFYITEDALFLLSDFLTACGLTGMAMDQAITAAVGVSVMGYVTQNPSTKDPQRVFNDITNFAPAA